LIQNPFRLTSGVLHPVVWLSVVPVRERFR